MIRQLTKGGRTRWKNAEQKNSDGCLTGPLPLIKLAVLTMVLLTMWLVESRVAMAQEPGEVRIPSTSKTTPSVAQAFSGEVQALEKDLLSVLTVEGGITEYFPVKKGVRVTSASGEKLSLQDLTPGTNVIIYFRQRNDRRTVTEIVVLVTGESKEKKKSSASS